MPSYLMLLHLDRSRPRPSAPEERQRMFEAYRDWGQRLRGEGRLTAGEKLTEDAGRVLQRRAERILVTDGPFAESKELVGGFFVIEAADYEEACRLCESCPHLAYGGCIELREIQAI